jgi:hypothetical protein
MSQSTGLLIFLIVLVVIFVIVLLAAIIGVSRRNKMGRPVTHATYGNNLDNANLSGSDGIDPRQQQQDGMNSPTGTGTNKSGNVPDSNRP